MSLTLEKETMNSLELDREVIRCKTCGLVQYRTRTGNCRRCVRALPQRLEFLIPPPAPEEEAGAETTPEKFANRETVENIGQRIRQLRESRAMTQSQLQSRSKVSRSYLSRIESGQMTPSLGTLEKDLRGAQRGPEPLLHSGIRRRSFAGGSVHPGIAAVPAAIGLGTVAVHSEEAAGDQRPCQRDSGHISALSVIPRGCRSPRRGMAMATAISRSRAIRMGMR